MANVEIRTKGPVGHVYINGKEVPDVRGYSISHFAGSFPVFKLEIAANELVLNGDGFVPELPDIYKPFYERKKATP